MSKIKLIVSIIFHAIYGAVCIQLTNSSHKDFENRCTLSYYHHQIRSITHLPLFRAKLWNNGIRCMSFYILIMLNTVSGCVWHISCVILGLNSLFSIDIYECALPPGTPYRTPSSQISIVSHWFTDNSIGMWALCILKLKLKHFICLPYRFQQYTHTDTNINHHECLTKQFPLTHLPLDKTAAIWSMTFSNAFSCMKMIEF